MLDLAAPVRSFRLLALEQVLKRDTLGLPLQEALRERFHAEDDPECRQMLGYVLERMSASTGPSPGGNRSPSPALAAEADWEVAASLQGRYPGLPELEKIRFLQGLPATTIAAAEKEGFDLMVREPNPLLKAALIEVFGPAFSPERLACLLGFLEDPCLSLRMKALEVLVRRDPQALLQHLPGRLVSEDPREQALAIQGLAAIDQAEALNHLDALLESPDPIKVLAALRISIYFPWNQVKPILLKGISLQKNPRVLEKIGMFLRSNPDPEVPYRLWAMLEEDPPDKKALLNDILHRVIDAIRRSGLLGERFPQYLDQLQVWVRRRKISRWLQEQLRLVESQPECLAGIEAGLASRHHHPEVRDLLLAARSWPLSPEARAHLHRWLIRAGLPPGEEASGETPAGERSPPREPAVQPAPAQPLPEPAVSPLPGFATLSVSEQIRALGTLDPAAPPAGEDILGLVLTLPGPAPSLVATSLRTAARAGDRRFLELARKALQTSDPNLLSAGIEYLGALDQDSLLPYLGKFLISYDPRVSGAVLKIWRHLDVAQSLGTLSRLLEHPSPEVRKVGLAGMIHFDIAAVRPLLTSFLLKAGSEEDPLVVPALFFIANNPAVDNLFDLYKIERAYAGRGWKGLAAKVAAAEGEMAAFLRSSGQIDQAWLDGRKTLFEARRAEEEAKARAAPAPYSRRVLQRRVAGPEPAWWEQKPWRAVLVSGVFLVAVALNWAGAPAPPPAAGLQQGPVVGSPISLEGLVTQADPRGLAFQATDRTSYLLLPPPGQTFTGVASGSRIRTTVVPFRQLGPGRFQAQCLSFER